MTGVKEQRICIKFCFKLGQKVSETHRIIKENFGGNFLSQTQTYEWFKRFKNGRMSVDDEERSGRHSTGTTTENVVKVDFEGIVHKEFVPPGQTVNRKFYCEFLRLMRSKHPAPTSRQVAQLLGPASRQRSVSRVTRCAAVSCYEYDSHPLLSLLTRTRPLRFFPIPEDEIDDQGATFRQH